MTTDEQANRWTRGTGHIIERGDTDSVECFRFTGNGWTASRQLAVEVAAALNGGHPDPATTQPTAERTIGPCGDTAEVPQVATRCVDTENGPRVEIAMLSRVYCWRVRSWWDPNDAAVIGRQIIDASRAALTRDAADTASEDQ